MHLILRRPAFFLDPNASYLTFALDHYTQHVLSQRGGEGTKVYR